MLNSILWVGNARGGGDLHSVEPRTGILKSLCENYLSFTPQTGDLKWSIRNSDHEGWLLCDGRTLSTTDYPNLYSIIGDSFGSPQLGYFSLPNPQDRILGVVGEQHNVGFSTGKETHVLNINELPPHSHSGTTDEHCDTKSTGSQEVLVGTGVQVVSTSESTQSHTHNFKTTSVGLGLPHSIMQPTLFIGNVFIYTTDKPE